VDVSESYSPGTRSRRSSLYCLAVPLVVALATGVPLLHKGPYWLGTNFDPDYAYLFNALALVTGHRPGHTDHPGTPAQLLFALILRVLHAGQGPAAIVTQVLRQPEYHLIVIQCVLLLLLCTTLYAAARVVLHATGSLVAALLCQISPLLSTTLLQEALCVKPEPLLLAMASLLAALTIRQACPQSGGARKFSWPAPVVLGALAGTAASTKLTALPLLMLPLLVVRGRGMKLVALLAACAVATLWLIPIWSTRPHFVSFGMRLATHGGRYGIGGETAHPAGNLAAIALLLAREPLFASALVSAVATLALRRQGTDAASRPIRVALLAMVATAIVQVAIVARHPYEGRYLLPALSLTGPLLAALWLMLRPLQAARPRRLSRIVASGTVLALTSGTLVVYLTDRTFRERRHIIDGMADVARRSDPVAPVICFYHASMPEFAMAYGNEWSRRYFTRELAALYPSFVYYTAGSSSFASFTRPLPRDQAVTSHRFVLRGMDVAHMPDLARRPEFQNVLYASPVETLYRAHVPIQRRLPFGDFVTDDLSAPDCAEVGSGTALVRTIVGPIARLRYQGSAAQPMTLEGTVRNPAAAPGRVAIDVGDGSLHEVVVPAWQTRTFSVALPHRTGVGSVALREAQPTQPEPAPNGRLLFLSLGIVPSAP